MRGFELNDRREAVLGMELKVRIEEDSRKFERVNQPHEEDMDKLPHGTTECAFADRTGQSMSSGKRNPTKQHVDGVAENSISLFAETEKEAKVSETMDDTAIIRNNPSSTQDTLPNGCGLGLGRSQACAISSGMNQIVEMEAGTEHEGGRERISEVSNVYIDKKLINPQAELKAEGSERIKNPNLDRVEKVTGVDPEDRRVPTSEHDRPLGIDPKDRRVQTSEANQGEMPTIVGLNDDEGSVIPPTPSCKKRKVVLFVAYCGVGYQGMQKNPGAVTIESHIEKALFKAGAIRQCNYGDLRKVGWARAARTDKGVSAVGQVISGKFMVDPPGFVERVNSHLPEEIRILGVKRVTNSFNAKKMCDRRRYEYVLPAFLFDPSVHLDRESMKELEREKILTSCHVDRQEEAESSNGDATNIVLDNLPHTSTDDLHEECIIKNLVQRTERERGLVFLEVHQERVGAEDRDRGVVVRHGMRSAVSSESQNASNEVLEKPTFRFGDGHVERLNTIFSHYIGTHNFHNFTSRIKPEDPSAKRYIVSFEVSGVFTIGSMDFVKCKVVGQSFILHQIRKMIGLAVAIMRGCMPISTIETALGRDANIVVPMAPEIGLFLDECMYTSYNEKLASGHGKISVHDFEKEISEFKWKQIYSRIASSEARDGVFALWLHSLNDRNHPVLISEQQK